ncbi:MAG: hypothetical protein Q9219_001200 [cf. Caloplaca sp. 3 TL-2023]
MLRYSSSTHKSISTILVLSLLNLTNAAFPLQSLPPFNYSDDQAHSLQVPIKPSQHPELDFRYTYRSDPGATLETSHVFATTSQQLWLLWRRADTPITQDSEERVPGFPGILHIVRPSLEPGAVLTSEKVALAYCWMMRQLLGFENPYSQFVVHVYNRRAGQLGALLGHVIVRYPPRPGNDKNTTTTSLLDSPEDLAMPGVNITVGNDPPAKLSLPARRETRQKAFLCSFTSLYFWILTHQYFTPVADSLPPFAPDQDFYHVYFPNPYDPAMEGKISFAKEDPQAPQRAIWSGFGTQGLVAQAVGNDRWEYGERTGLVVGGRRVVDVRFGARHGDVREGGVVDNV